MVIDREVTFYYTVAVFAAATSLCLLAASCYSCVSERNTERAWKEVKIFLLAMTLAIVAGIAASDEHDRESASTVDVRKAPVLIPRPSKPLVRIASIEPGTDKLATPLRVASFNF